MFCENFEKKNQSVKKETVLVSRHSMLHILDTACLMHRKSELIAINV